MLNLFVSKKNVKMSFGNTEHQQKALAKQLNEINPRIHDIKILILSRDVLHF